jgi:predicted nucleotidyltransferase
VINLKISGIICEYNPFHNGHLYHVNKTRENGATHIISVMSGNFVQRGDTALIDKFSRAKTAVECGADLVIELPFPYAVSGAENFARGAVYLLDSAGCVDEISFGSETGDIEKLKKSAQISRICSQMPELKSMLENGMSYPSASALLVRKYYGDEISDILSKPNNVLAVEYIKALDFFSSDIKPFTVSRNSAGHDTSEVSGIYASASYIRDKILSGCANEIYPLVPEFSADVIRNNIHNNSIADIGNLERIILYKLRTSARNIISDVPDVAHGLENRIISSANATSLENLVNMIKNKRYTMSRIRRIILNSVAGVRKSDLDIFPPYCRILAMNHRGIEILSCMKKKSRLPFSASLMKLSRISENCRRYSEIEAVSSDIYNLALDKIKPSGSDFKTKIQAQN